jgi:small-conductance mechanosensitive channel
MEGMDDYSRLFNELDSQALIELGLVLGGAILLILLSQKALNWVANRLHGQYRFRVFALVPLARLAILVAAIGMAVPIVIEPSLRNMITLLGAVGLAIGFALRDYVSSLIAGVVAAVEMPYRPGDWVEVEGTYGEVVHVGMRTIEVVTPDDDLVSIPHLKIWDSAIHNANNGGDSLQCVADFHLHPDHDAQRVTEALRDVALTSPYLRLDRPVAVVASEQPWGTHYKVRAYPVDPRQQFRFVTDLTLRGRAVLGRLGARPVQVPVTPGNAAS